MPSCSCENWQNHWKFNQRPKRASTFSPSSRIENFRYLFVTQTSIAEEEGHDYGVHSSSNHVSSKLTAGASRGFLGAALSASGHIPDHWRPQFVGSPICG